MLRYGTSHRTLEICGNNAEGKVGGRVLTFINIYVNCLAIYIFYLNDELYAYIFTLHVLIYRVLSYP